MPAQSRQQARQYDDGSWQNTFKQGILLADAKITPYERRQLVARIDALSTEIPAQVRPLYQLWRDGQALQLQLAEERQRYGKLQQASDSELIHCASNITFYSSNWNSPPASWKT